MITLRVHEPCNFHLNEVCYNELLVIQNRYGELKTCISIYVKLYVICNL